MPPSIQLSKPTPEKAALNRQASELLTNAWLKFRACFKRCRNHCTRKSVHQLRVQARRLRAALRLVRPMADEDAVSAARRRLKRLLQRLARLRDVHVQLQYVDHHSSQTAGRRGLKRSLNRREQHLADELAARMRKSRLRPFHDDLKAVLRAIGSCAASRPKPASAGDHFFREITKAFLKVHHLSVPGRTGNAAALHRMRVAFKEFRYMAELLNPTLTMMSPAQLEEMAAFQTQLGEIQDTVVMIVSFDKLERARPRSSKVAHAIQRGLKRRLHALVRKFVSRIDDLERFRPSRPVPPRRHAAGMKS